VRVARSIPGRKRFWLDHSMFTAPPTDIFIDHSVANRPACQLWFIVNPAPIASLHVFVWRNTRPLYSGQHRSCRSLGLGNVNQRGYQCVAIVYDNTDIAASTCPRHARDRDTAHTLRSKVARAMDRGSATGILTVAEKLGDAPMMDQPSAPPPCSAGGSNLKICSSRADARTEPWRLTALLAWVECEHCKLVRADFDRCEGLSEPHGPSVVTRRRPFCDLHRRSRGSRTVSRR